MERVLQYLDDIDDIVGALGLVYESFRRLCFGIVALAGSLVLTGSGVWLALINPLMALATCLLLFVTLLYRTVISPPRGRLQAS
ncbi:MAG: hypothetical protein ACR2RD_04085 [Woeseiaceae bacterium]